MNYFMLHFNTITEILYCKKMITINKPADQKGRPSDLSESCVLYCAMKCDKTQVAFSPTFALVSREWGADRGAEEHLQLS